MIKWLPQTTKLFHHWAAVIVCISSLGLFSRYVLWAACSEWTRFIHSFIRYVWSGHSAQGLVTFVPPHSPGHGVDQNEWGRSGRGRARSAEKWTVGEAKNTPVIPLGSAEPKCSDQVQHFGAERQNFPGCCPRGLPGRPAILAQESLGTRGCPVTERPKKSRTSLSLTGGETETCYRSVAAYPRSWKGL